MKNSSDYIAKAVFSVNAHYTKKQNKTKLLFFDCLKKNKSVEYFKKEANKIWGNVNHKFMDKQIEELINIVHSNNVKQAINLGRLEKKYKMTDDWVIDDEYFKLTPEEYFQKFEHRFENNVEKIYENSIKNIDKLDSETYLEKQLENYNKNVNQIVTYFTKAGEPLRQVQLSTYLSMIHNTNLTRSGWNTTMTDSEYLDMNLFIIPYHSFSCPDCFSYQNKVLTKKEVENIIGKEAEEQVGDLLHPNCKCTLSIYWDDSQIQRNKIEFENNEEYKIRQKVNALTLEKANLRANQGIASDLGFDGLADKYNSQRNKINKTIRELKEQLPTEELQKQVTAIKR